MTDSAKAARWRGPVVLCALAALLPPVCVPSARADEASDALASRGRAVYAEHCGGCHGSEGQGEEGVYEEALFGDKSLTELTRYLETSMPDGSPEDVVGEDAAAAARYIYDAFYSPVAQDRLRPARVEAVRLTERQFRQAVADAVNRRDATPATGAEEGLVATYSIGSRWRSDAKIEDVKIGSIDFAISDAWPGAPVVPMTPEEIAARDEDLAKQRSAKKDGPKPYEADFIGGVRAYETGTHEFIVETTGGFQLYVGDYGTPALDREVKSGDTTRYAVKVPLLEGRVTPLRLEVEDERRPGNFVRLKWRRPHGVEEVIPARALTRERVEPTYALATPLPPDDASTGYPRGNGMSPEWVEAAAQAAVAVGNDLAADPRRWTGVKEDDPERAKKTLDYLLGMAERAWRRPLTGEERATIEAAFDAEDVESSLRLAAIRVFASPRFLLREVNVGEFDGPAAASWVSFLLWDSVPDRKLRQKGEKGQLSSEKNLRQTAWEAVYDPRSKSKLRDFMLRWLRTDHFHEISKNPEVFPEFDERVAADLKTSLDLFLDDVLWGQEPRWSRLLTSREVYLNGRLSRLYGGEVGGDAFEKVDLAGQPRAGLLSHPYIMAGFSYDKTTSPIHRGVFLSKSILGRVLKNPPDAVSPLPPDLHADLSTRERVALQTQSTTCQSCHSMINPLGFALEHFDAIGRVRSQDQAKPVDASGVYLTKAGEEVPFEDVAGLAGWISQSDEAREAFVSHLFHSATGQSVRAFGPEYLPMLVQKFRESGDNVPALLVEIVVTPTLRLAEASENAAVAAK